MPRILALDLSLTDTGVCALTVGPGGLLSGTTSRIKSKAGGTRYCDVSSRISMIAQAINFQVTDHRPDLVVIESPALGSTTGQAHSRAWLWGSVYDGVRLSDTEIITITPQGVKMYATGRGNADKDEVLAAVIKRFGPLGLDVTNNNVADAVTEAAVGARYIGCPIDGDMPKANLRAMDKLSK